MIDIQTPDRAASPSKRTDNMKADKMSMNKVSMKWCSVYRSVRQRRWMAVDRNRKSFSLTPVVSTGFHSKSYPITQRSSDQRRS